MIVSVEHCLILGCVVVAHRVESICFESLVHRSSFELINSSDLVLISLQTVIAFSSSLSCLTLLRSCTQQMNSAASIVYKD